MIKRGEIWWASLTDPVGSDPGFRRPVLVVQSDEFNESRIQTVVVLTFTSNLRLASAAGKVLCRRAETGLPGESVVNDSQAATINKTRMTQRVGKLPARLM